MVAVSQELLVARKEARRVSAQGLEKGTYRRSQAEGAVAQESEAQTLLQSQLEYAQAQDELNEAIGSANDCRTTQSSFSPTSRIRNEKRASSLGMPLGAFRCGNPLGGIVASLIGDQRFGTIER